MRRAQVANAGRQQCSEHPDLRTSVDDRQAAARGYKMAEPVVRSSGLGEGWCLVVVEFEVPAGHEECGDAVADR